MGVTPRVGSIPTSGTLARSRSLERRSCNQALDLRRSAPRSQGDEMEGLDVTQHGEEAYIHDGGFSTAIPVDEYLT